MKQRAFGWVVMAACISAACRGPAIQSFEVLPRSLCPGDTVVIRWQVRGTPTLLTRLADPRFSGGDDVTDEDLESAPDTLEFVLSVRKGDNEAVRRIAVLQFPDMASDVVVFATTLRGDTLIAAGIKNPIRWGDRFEILTVASDPPRALEIQHAGRTISLAGGGAASDGLRGTPLEGEWEIRSPLTARERTDSASRPERFELRAVIHCERGTP